MIAKPFQFAGALLVVAAVMSGCAERRAENFRRQGDELFALERYDEAIAYYTRAAELNPQDGRVRSSLGRCHAAKTEYGAAAEQFQAAVALDKTARSLHAQNVSILRDAGQAEAADALSRAIHGAAAQEPAALASPPADWRQLWRRGALHELVGRRAEFESGDGLTETLLIAALLTGNRAAAEEAGGALAEDAPLRAYYAALSRGDLSVAVEAATGWKPAEAITSLRDYALGYALALAGARGRAVQAYSDALKNWPDQAAAHYAMAQVFAACRMPKLADKCLYNLLKQGGENLPARLMIYETQKQAGMTAEARQTAETVYRIAPDSASGAVALAECLAGAHEAELAETVLRRAIAANPGDTRLQAALAAALLRQGRPAEALKELAGLDAQPAASRIAAFAQARLGNWADAESSLQSAKAGDQSAVFLLAAAAAHQGRFEEARALLSGPDEHLPELCAGWAYFHGGLFEAALETFEPLLDSREPAGVLTATFACMDRLFSGDELIERAKDLAQKHARAAEAWIGLAGVLENSGDTPGARAALDTALSLAPDSAAVLKARGRFFEQSGETEQAVAALRRLVEIEPEDAGAANNLAYLLLMLDGDAAEALGFAEHAAAAAPADASVLHTLGLAQFRAGKLAESEATLARALELRPLEPTLLLDYGHALVAGGRAEDGAAQVALAMRLSAQLGLEFPRRAEAEKLLEGTRAL